MASTDLFAPQIRSVQPAFVYNKSSGTGTVRVYFTPSPLNKIDGNDKQISYILYSIIDPSLTSTWGSNSMFQGSQIRGSTSGWEKNDSTNEYYFEFNITTTNFKDFSTNKYYQLQLYFEDTSDEKGTAARGTQSWLTANADRISEASQPSLLRPIDAPSITFTTLTSTGQNDASHPIYEFSTLTGYVNSDIETLESCSCTIGTDTYTSPTVAVNGKNFSIPIDNNKVPESTARYSVTFNYKTIHGYSSTVSTYIYYAPPVSESEGPSISGSAVLNDDGAVSLTLDGVGKLQRKAASQGGWHTIKESVSSGDWIDYTVEAGESYEYRIVNTSNKTGGVETTSSIDFEEIFLSDKNAMVAIRYNPNISGFKYVTQESITNTLGGRYPIIRKNGDTKYRQFTISGIIDNSCAVATSTSFTDSTTNTTKTNVFDAPKPGSLYVINTTPFTGLSDQKLEREIRRVTMDFLTDSKPKLFRSFEEGNIIVYLSNVSFTPNKTLGRHIYDFSATVTEMCEYNGQNLEKYKLNLGGYTKVTQSTSGGN